MSPERQWTFPGQRQRDVAKREVREIKHPQEDLSLYKKIMCHKVPEDSKFLFIYNKEHMFPGITFFQASFPVLREPTDKSEYYLVSEKPEHWILNDVVGGALHQRSCKAPPNAPVLELYPTTLQWPKCSGSPHSSNKNEHVFSWTASPNYLFLD